MDEGLKVSAPQPAVVDSKGWIGRILIAVVLGEAIWGLLVSITNHLVVPAMTRVMGGDPQSPLYLGKGDFNVPALLTSVLEACFAGIVAVFMNSWTQKSRSARYKSARVVSERADRPPSVMPTAPAAVPPPASNASALASATAVLDTAVRAETPASAQSMPRPPQSVPQPAPPAKPKPPKKVYYNIVGEPIEDDE